MSANSTGYQAILVGNVGRNVTHTPGHLKFVIKYEESSSEGGVRSERVQHVLCHIFGKYADTMSRYLYAGIKVNAWGRPGIPHTAVVNGEARAFNTLVVERLQVHEYREAEKIADLEQQLAEARARIHELTLASEQDHIAALEAQLAQAAREMNALDDTVRTQRQMILAAPRTPDEPEQPELLTGDLPTIPTGDPEPPALEVIEEDEGEPMPAF